MDFPRWVAGKCRLNRRIGGWLCASSGRCFVGKCRIVADELLDQLVDLLVRERLDFERRELRLHKRYRGLCLQTHSPDGRVRDAWINIAQIIP